MQLERENLAPFTAQVLFRGGQSEKIDGELLSEYKLDIYVDGNPRLHCLCILSDLKYLVIGRLFTAGIIKDVREIEECVIDEDAHCARVKLKECKEDFEPEKREFYHWEPEWIFRLADAFSEDTELHRKTSCTHSCFLARKDKVLCAAEDIGRHNAMDKVIGRALLEGIDLSKCILYTSGRVPTDMLEKVIRAGVPVVVSNAVPTKDAVILAEKNRITLIGGARTDKMKLYTDFRK